MNEDILLKFFDKSPLLVVLAALFLWNNKIKNPDPVKLAAPDHELLQRIEDNQQAMREEFRHDIAVTRTELRSDIAANKTDVMSHVSRLDGIVSTLLQQVAQLHARERYSPNSNKRSQG